MDNENARAMKPSHRRNLSASLLRSWSSRAREVLDLTARKVYATQREAATAIGCSAARVCQVLAGDDTARAAGHRLRWRDECPDAKVED